MRLFRSEEHVENWLRMNDRAKGHVFSPEQLWRLAQLWFADRLSPTWRRFTPDEIRDVFAKSGLTGDFWRVG